MPSPAELSPPDAVLHFADSIYKSARSVPDGSHEADFRTVKVLSLLCFSHPDTDPNPEGTCCNAPAPLFLPEATAFPALLFSCNLSAVSDVHQKNIPLLSFRKALPS